MRNQTGFYVFVLLFTLIIVVYYVGASTNFLTFARGSQTILYALSGRLPNGQFAQYARDPGGAV